MFEAMFSGFNLFIANAKWQNFLEVELDDMNIEQLQVLIKKGA